MKPVEARAQLLSLLRLDLIGPEPGSPYEREALPQAPSRWYLTGFLVPYEAPADQREDEQGQEQLDLSGAMGATDDDETPEPASARLRGAVALIARSPRRWPILRRNGDVTS